MRQYQGFAFPKFGGSIARDSTTLQATSHSCLERSWRIPMCLRPSLFYGLFTVALSYSAISQTAPLPPPIYNLTLEYPVYPVRVIQQTQATPGLITQDLTGPYGSGTATSSLAAEPTPYLFASTTAVGTGDGSVLMIGSSTELTYEFEVVGPAGTQVPVDVSASGSATSSGSGNGGSLLFIYENPAGQFTYEFGACSDSHDPSGCSEKWIPEFFLQCDSGIACYCWRSGRAVSSSIGRKLRQPIS
jgi:hypothetical protein